MIHGEWVAEMPCSLFKSTIMINREKFYLSVVELFGSRLRQEQVDGFEAILNEWEKWQLKDLRWLAYMLATAWHETAKTMEAIEEYGKGKGRKYGVPEKGKIYYGRGLVQLTWGSNYKKMGNLLDIELYEHPELALDLNIAVKIMFEGMTTAESFRGDFTGKDLSMYFNAKKEDWVNARRIINGLDKAELIANYGRRFHKALSQ